MFEADRAVVEFGGGFYHYGYRVRLEQEDPPRTNRPWVLHSVPRYNVWELYLSREGQPEKLFFTPSESVLGFDPCEGLEIGSLLHP